MPLYGESSMIISLNSKSLEESWLTDLFQHGIGRNDCYKELSKAITVTIPYQ